MLGGSVWYSNDGGDDSVDQGNEQSKGGSWQSQDGGGYSSYWGILQFLAYSAPFSCKVSSTLASQASKMETGISSKQQVP